MKHITVIPTYKCNSNCDYCYTQKMDKSHDLEYDDDLISILSSYDSMFITGGEPFVYPQIYDLIKLCPYVSINSNFHCEPTEIERALLIRPDLKFYVTYQSTPAYRRTSSDNFNVNLKMFWNKIDILHYVFFIQNHEQAKIDLEYLRKSGKRIEYIFYFDSHDIEYLSSLNENDRSEIAFMIKSIFNQNIFEKRDAVLNNIEIIGPQDHKTYSTMQRCNKNCTNCYPLSADKNLCESCIDYCFSNNFNIIAKDNYIDAIERLKQLLKV